MSVGLAICLVCGEPLDYFEEAQEVTCHICGKKETGHSICTAGHYVCDACHRAGGVNWVLEECKKQTSKDPIEIAQHLMNDKSIFPNGPEHHTLIGASLMTAYKNAGGEIDLDKGLEELKKRSLQVPGGTCGFWGTCGAATSAGQFYSIISGSTPMTSEPWGQTQRLTSNILGALADLGGPRCCKRTGFTSILESAKYVKEVRGVEMDIPETVTCTHFHRNMECLRERCPFFPKKEQNA
ncbi:MAG: DUF5714 domain-containing protein [Coriobacteriia bacterium]|nr:DUF5714 domain-containing protein [Coriobacteriia bacterium]